MPASVAKGTVFNIGAVAVGALTSISGVAISADTIDVTAINSASGYKEYLASWKDGGEVSLSGFFDNSDAGQAALYAALNTGAVTAFTIVFPAAIGTQWGFNGIITAYETGASLEDAISFDATIKITGQPALTTAASTGMSAVTISNSAVLAPTFAIGVFDYVATVLTGVSSLTFTPTAAAGTITITANGVSQTVTTGNASSAIALGAAGSITIVTVVVQEANKTPKTYTFRIDRP